MNKRVLIIVRGRVQGVFFRAATRDFAMSLDLAGYVRNLPNSNVEIVAEGPESGLRELVEWARKGPPMAEVFGVEVEYTNPVGQFAGFTIWHEC